MHLRHENCCYQQKKVEKPTDPKLTSHHVEYHRFRNRCSDISQVPLHHSHYSTHAESISYRASILTSKVCPLPRRSRPHRCSPSLTNGRARIELNTLPPPATQTPKWQVWSLHDWRCCIMYLLSRTIFSWCLAESCMLFFLLMLQGWEVFSSEYVFVALSIICTLIEIQKHTSWIGSHSSWCMLFLW